MRLSTTDRPGNCQGLAVVDEAASLFFGNPAISERPVALRPDLAIGLPLSETRSESHAKGELELVHRKNPCWMRSLAHPPETCGTSWGSQAEVLTFRQDFGAEPRKHRLALPKRNIGRPMATNLLWNLQASVSGRCSPSTQGAGGGGGGDIA